MCYVIFSIFLFVLCPEPAPVPEESRKKKGITYEELRNKHRQTYEVMQPPKAETPSKFSQEKPAKEGNTLIYTNTCEIQIFAIMLKMAAYIKLNSAYFLSNVYLVYLQVSHM